MSQWWAVVIGMAVGSAMTQFGIWTGRRIERMKLARNVPNAESIKRMTDLGMEQHMAEHIDLSIRQGKANVAATMMLGWLGEHSPYEDTRQHAKESYDRAIKRATEGDGGTDPDGTDRRL